MKLFFRHVKESIEYAFADKKAILVICVLMAITAIIYKNGSVNPILKLVTVTLLIVVGYGSYISWYTLKDSDEHPKFKNLKKLIWEGFKKTFITFIYSGFLVLFFFLAKQSFDNGNIIIAVFLAILSALIYLFLIIGLLNIYLHGGEFFKAFNLVEIHNLILSFEFKSLIKFIIVILISQIFSITIIIVPFEEVSASEFIYSIATLFLSPFLYIANKRLVGLNVRELLKNRKD